MLLVSELKMIPFLGDVPPEELATWGPSAEPYDVRRRQNLFSPGDPIEHLILLRSGLVVFCLEAAVGETRMTAIVDNRRCINIAGLHPRARQTMCAVTLTDCQLVRVPIHLVREAVGAGGTLARLLAAFAAASLTELSDEFIRATTQDVRTRAASVMIRLMDALGTNEIPLSQEQIAGLIGTRRETLALTLGEMRRENTLDTRYRRIRVLDRQTLHADTKGTYPTCVPNAIPSPLTGSSGLE